MARKQRAPQGKRFRLRFKGGDVASPGQVRIGELADLLLSLEAGIASIAGANVAEVGLSLVRVEGRSAAYLFAPQEAPQFDPREAGAPSEPRISSALRIWSATVEDGDPSTLPEPAQETTKKVLAFVRRHGCVGELKESGERRPLTRITPNTVMRGVPPAPIKGPSVLYGKALRVGGVVPKLLLRIDDARAISVDVASEALARQLGERLYHTIGVSGMAEWNPTTNALVGFLVEDLLPYAGVPTEALAQVSNLVGADLSALVDVEGAVESVRSLADL